MSHDDITNPKHYDLFPDGMQAIDVIRAALTPEEFAGYCKGNFLKYRLRAGEKGPAERCIGKSEWYRARLQEHHDFMSSEAITQAEHEKLKAEGAAKAATPAWPTAPLRQDSEAEDEAFAAIQPYTGPGGVMIQCPGCTAQSCECWP